MPVAKLDRIAEYGYSEGNQGAAYNAVGRSALKLIWLAAAEAAKKWTMPIRDWKAALNFFLIQFEDRH